MDLRKELDLLNEKQLAAIVSNDVPLRIIAGAGSGKTRVITMKIAYLVQELNVPSRKILAVTFTNKAAKEMKERVISILGDRKSSNPVISTFHSFCFRLLREEHEAAKLEKYFTIIDTNDQKTIIKSILKDLGIEQKKYNKAETKALSAIEGWKNNFYTYEEAYEESAQEEYRDYAKAWKKYDEVLKENNYVDFNDLQIKAYEVLRDNLEIRSKWKDRYDYVLVDEFQDTNDLQFDLIKLLTEGKNNLTVVGDPDQTIYSWRGAKVNIILNFEKVYKNAKTIILDRNYRSTQQILDLANSFIENNANRQKKDIYTDTKGKVAQVHESATQKGEASYVAKKIKDLTQAGEYDYRDFFILYRANAWSRELENALSTYKIPYQLIGGIKFRERKVIKDSISYLKAVSIKDNISVERSLKNTPRVGEQTIDKIKNFAELNETTLFNALTMYKEEMVGISKYLGTLIDLLIKGSEMVSNNIPPADVLKYLLVESGYEEKVKLTSKNEDDEQNINALYDQLNGFTENFDASLYGEENITIAFLQEEALGDEIDEEVPNKVTLLTIHSAKGLENNVVFVTGLSAGIFPSKRTLFNNAELEEERRTLYVALTRAKKELYVSYVNGEYSYITQAELAPSRFIREMNNEYYELEKTVMGSLVNNQTIISRNTIGDKTSQKIETDIKENDIVNHVFFGDGVVIKIVNNQFQIAFNNPAYGIRLIPIGNAAITKK